jgi:hypothetical protein
MVPKGRERDGDLRGLALSNISIQALREVLTGQRAMPRPSRLFCGSTAMALREWISHPMDDCKLSQPIGLMVRRDRIAPRGRVPCLS